MSVKISGLKDQTAQSDVSAVGLKAMQNIIQSLQNKVSVMRINGTSQQTREIEIARTYLKYLANSHGLASECVNQTASQALVLMDEQAEISKADAYADYVANQEGESL